MDCNRTGLELQFFRLKNWISQGKLRIWSQISLKIWHLLNIEFVYLHPVRHSIFQLSLLEDRSVGILLIRADGLHYFQELSLFLITLFIYFSGIQTASGFEKKCHHILLDAQAKWWWQQLSQNLLSTLDFENQTTPNTR